MKKLSDRAIVILTCIAERSKPKDRDPSEIGYWRPSWTNINADWSSEMHQFCNIQGSDWKILVSLKTKGLTEKPAGDNPHKYAARITEDGILEIEKARESGRLKQIEDNMYKDYIRVHCRSEVDVVDHE